jgi:hypothetical protein
VSEELDLLDVVTRIEVTFPDRTPLVIDEVQLAMARLVRDGVLVVEEYEDT